MKIYTNWLNGNITDARKQLSKLTPKQGSGTYYRAARLYRERRLKPVYSRLSLDW
jgi:hypothetical protein